MESKVSDAEKLNNSLEDEIAKVKADNVSSERMLKEQFEEQDNQLQDMRQRLDDQERDFDEQLRRTQQQNKESTSMGRSGQMNGDYEDLLRKHEDLKAELKEQQEVKILVPWGAEDGGGN